MPPLEFLQRCGIFRLSCQRFAMQNVSEPAFGIWLIRPRNNIGVITRRSFSTSRPYYNTVPSFTSGSTVSKSLDNLYRTLFKKKNASTTDNMGYFVIGVSGVTCGGKTTLTKLLLRKFPWAQVIHQDHYFYDDDCLNHIRVPEAENHVNYEILDALDMKKMYKDVQAILEAPPKFREVSPVIHQSNGVGDKAETPNFDDKFLQQIPDISYDVSKYNKIPILIIEGFTIFASQYLFDVCHARFFCSLDKETCRKRRSVRSYFPPDTPSYFEKIVWPEYLKHFDNCIHKRPGVAVFDGNTLIADLWKASVEIITCRIEEKLGAENASSQFKG